MSYFSKLSFSFGTVAKVATLTLGATAAVACSDSNSPPAPAGRVYVVNAAPLQPTIGLKVGGTAVANTNFAAQSSFLVGASTTPKTITAYAANGTTLLASTDLTIADNMSYNLVLSQTAPGVATTDFLSFPDTVSAPASGKVKVRVLNFSPIAPLFDLYVYDASTNISAATALATGGTAVAYRASSNYFELPSGAKHIAVTAPGTKTILAEIPTLTLNAGTAITVLTFDKLAGGAPLQINYWQDR